MNKSLFSEYFVKALICVDALLITFISIYQGRVILGALILFIIALLLNLIALSFSTAYYLLEAKNEYGSEKKMEHAKKMFRIFYSAEMIILTAVIVLSILKI